MRRAVIPLLLLGVLLLTGGSSSKPPLTGPATEKRFPPLKVPQGFKATLFACEPMIEYPSVIALGPRPRSLFVAIDYMTGLGTGIVRRDEIRLLEDTDGDGYADKATVFASGFNSIQGLAYHQGTLYVMHAPYLTALRDTKGTGKADERRDLLTGLGLAPEVDQIRLHNANGVVAGHDGWLYLALGDRGCRVDRPEGDRLVLEGGGILRCRPDGRDLHVFATGLRNIYDVALDEELNVFVRDNENDGGTYMVRVCHSFFGADHGYPYLYAERPDEAVPPLADLGLGSSAGGLCYLERQFPAEYRGNLLFCEWGRSVVRYRPQRRGATFAPLREIEFAAGAPNDPYGFKPTDLVVGHDGSLFIADWADGQRPKRGRGRIYQVRHTGEVPRQPPAPPGDAKKATDLNQALALLDSDSYLERCRGQEYLESHRKGTAAVRAALEGKRLGLRGKMHAVWILAKVGGAEAAAEVIALANRDPDPRVQAQAVRACADLIDPVLVRHRLDSGPGDEALAVDLIKFAHARAEGDPRVLLEVVLALGRLRWTGAPAWLRRHIKGSDPVLAHAAQWAMRRAGNWPAVLKLLDEPNTEPFRAVARGAVAGQYATEVVDGLIARLRREADPVRRRAYADALTRVYKKPAPWTYWGFRPAPRPAHSVAWESTAAIQQALEVVLADPDRAVRRDVLRRMTRELIPAAVATLSSWLAEERDADTVAALLEALREPPAAEVRPHLERVLRDGKHTTANRLLAASLFLQGLDKAGEARLLAAADALEDGPVLAELLRAVGKRRVAAAVPLLARKVAAPAAEVRAAAVGALAELNVSEASSPIRKLLEDPDAGVRSAAASAAGQLGLRAATEQLLKGVQDRVPDVRRASLEALRRLREPRALPFALKALADRETALKALDCVGEVGGPEHVRAVTELARREPAAEILAGVGKVLAGWAARPRLSAEDRRAVEGALAEVHGSSGLVLGWYAQGPLAAEKANAALAVDRSRGVSMPDIRAPGWRLQLTTGLDARLRLGAAQAGANQFVAAAEIAAAEAGPVEFFTAGSGPATIWLNDLKVYRRQQAAAGPYPERFEAPLRKGRNRIHVLLTAGERSTDLQLRFRRKGANPDHERLTLASLSRAGNPAAGRRVFLDAGKSLCVKCHRVGDQGERIGPELTGVGSRFAKAYLIESILEPSRTIAPSFATTVVVLKDGRAISGVKVTETETSLTLADAEARKHVLMRAGIEEVRHQPVSTMPEGLERRLTEDEFVDLIAFLTSLKDNRPR